MDDLSIKCVREGGQPGYKKGLRRLSWTLMCIAPLVACQGSGEQGDIGQLESSLEEADVEFEEEASEPEPSVPSALVALPPSSAPAVEPVLPSRDRAMLLELRRLRREERAYFVGTVTSISDRTMSLPDSMLFSYEREVGREFPVRVAEVSVLANHCNTRENTVSVVFRSGESAFPTLAEGGTYAILGRRQEVSEGTQVLVSTHHLTAKMEGSEALPPLLPAQAAKECLR